MRFAWMLLAGVAACSGDRPPPPKVADAPMRDTQPLPTASVAADPVPSSTTPPIASSAPKSMPSASASSAPTTGTGALTQAECDKVIHKFAELVAQEQGASLMEGFQSNPIYGAMRSLCVTQTTRAQHDCAVAAKSTQKWQECMK